MRNARASFTCTLPLECLPAVGSRVEMWWGGGERAPGCGAHGAREGGQAMVAAWTGYEPAVHAPCPVRDCGVVWGSRSLPTPLHIPALLVTAVVAAWLGAGPLLRRCRR